MHGQDTFNDRSPCQLMGVLTLGLWVFIQSAFAQSSYPANFSIERAEIYKHPKQDNNHTSPIHISDILTVKLHWSLYNATLDNYVALQLDRALQIIQPQTLEIIGRSGDQKPVLKLATCNEFQLSAGVIFCPLDEVPQKILNEYGTLNGFIHVEATLNSNFIGDGAHRVFEFANANFDQEYAYSADIAIARPENYEKVTIPESKMQRTCSWGLPADGYYDKVFVCTISFPIGYNLSRVLVSDNILRGNARPVGAVFIQEDVNDLKKQTFVSIVRYKETYARRGYELRMRPLVDETLDGSKYRYRLAITYESHHGTDDVKGFVGIAKIRSKDYGFEQKSYLPPFSTWKRIFPHICKNDHEEWLSASIQYPLIPSEQIQLPAYSVMAGSHRDQLSFPLSIGSEEQGEWTTPKSTTNSSDRDPQSIEIKHSLSPLHFHMNRTMLYEAPKGKITATTHSRMEFSHMRSRRSQVTQGRQARHQKLKTVNLNLS